jgi:hypothetical protein
MDEVEKLTNSRLPSDTQTYVAGPINFALNYYVFLKRQSTATRRGNMVRVMVRIKTDM